MKLKKPENSNYAAVVAKISNIIALPNCDNVSHASVLGNLVIVGNDCKKGDIGIYFPLETQISKDFLSANNMFRKEELNTDKEKKGYFEENGRVRCIKFRQNKSEGLFVPLEYLSFTGINVNELTEGDEFDFIGDIKICEKYVVKRGGNLNGKGTKKVKKEDSKLIANQFRFHEDTSMLYKNMHKLEPDTVISLTYKIHGTSAISSNILCKKKLNIFEKVLKKIGVDIIDTEYSNIYSSRKVIKNNGYNTGGGYYSEDVWGIGNKELKEHLTEGLTLYYEIAGYLPDGGFIQKNFDYGHKPGEHGLYIYRITYTTPYGKVYEFSVPQVKQWCQERGLSSVPSLWYGKVKDLYAELASEYNKPEMSDEWRSDFLEMLKLKYNDKDCFMCTSKVPEEGAVLRIEGLEFDAYKLKSESFYRLETKMLDKGEGNIEDNA